MSAAACEVGAIASTDDAKRTPFAQQWVSLTKQEHIELVMQARSWKSLHERAVRRNQWLQTLLRRQHEQAEQRESALRAQLDLAQAKIRDLQLRMYGRKSERRWSVEGRGREHAASPRSRGQQRGAPGHSRTRLTHLSACEETVELDSPRCPACGAALSVFPGTDDSEVLEIDVRAYRRVIHRQRYRCNCGCGVLPRIVAAPAPPRLTERGKFGISVWVNVLLDKFLYGCPSQRLLHEMADHGLPMSAGTLAGGLRTLAPLFAPLHEALREKLRSEPHWHADETRNGNGRWFPVRALAPVECRRFRCGHGSGCNTSGKQRAFLQSAGLIQDCRRTAMRARIATRLLQHLNLRPPAPHAVFHSPVTRTDV